MLLLACPVESDTAELTWFRMFTFLSQFVRAAALYLSKELTLLVSLIYPSLIGVTLFLVFTVSPCTMHKNISRCIIVVQNVMSVSSCILNGVFIYFEMQVMILVLFFFLNLLTRSDGCLFECSHKSHNLKKIGKRMIVILHHKAC